MGYRRDDVIFREGEPSTYLLLLKQGLVKVTAASETGQVTLLAIRGPGDVIGELSAADGHPQRSATVVAAADVQACLISHQDFIRLTQQRPEIMVAMLHVLSDKLRQASRARVEVHTYTVRMRLAHVLVELAQAYGQEGVDGTRIDLSLTQPELAALVSASPASIARCLRELRQRQILDIGYRHVTLHDMKALAALTQS
ncbi:Crp/Fnr family transcriptional regulator [Streptomyces sp. NPDC059168]|uniref:Crp/Fnr family transcriptional regulator n=1 Tax=Streptomyces sp. NPDC059168 TaxID=3346753 RepID=UPI0036C21628